MTRVAPARFALGAVAAPLLALALAPAVAGPPAETTRIAASVERQQPALVALLERLVNRNSGTMNHAGVTEIGRMLRPEFEALGFAVNWKPMAAAGRAGHLIAEHRGRPGGKRILLIGHLDTVFEADQPFQTFVRQGDWASGPGAADDKGGIIVMLGALRAMHDAGTLRDANIVVVLTGDEEAMGEPAALARADLIAEGRRADVALDFEGLIVERGIDMGSVARRSSNSWKITASGNGGHSSGIFSAEAGDGAIFELARIVQAFRTELPEPDLTFNVGLIAGGAQAALNADESGVTAGGKTNIIPSVAVATGDFRTLTPEQTERVRARMVAIVARHAPGTNAQITFGESYPPMAPTPGNRALLAQLNRVNALLGLPEMPELPPIKRGAGDISFVAADVDGLAGLGPASTGDHSPAERVDLTSIPRQAKRAALLMSMLSREPGAKSKP